MLRERLTRPASTANRQGRPGLAGRQTIAGSRRVRGFHDPAVHADVALFDQALHRATRGGREFSPEKHIKPSIR